MILFIAPNPNKAKEREGYMQRVAAIDDVFKDEQKIYYDDISNDDNLADYLLAAKIIYVHSIYQSSKILSQYPDLGYKIITDLHGVVPEEEELAGNHDKSIEMQEIENTVFKYGKNFVAVTNTMVGHYKNKYKLPKDVNWVILPIFKTVNNRYNQSIKNNTVVYAGGAQKWQNIDKMIAAVESDKQSLHKYVILTHDIESFKELKTSRSNVIVKTVSSKKVFDYYNNASLGFVLRDDNIVNNVACPTKLIEYMSMGVVPIVLSPKIGDFYDKGYSFIKLEDFINRKKISDTELEKGAKKNLEVIREIEKVTLDGKKTLLGLYSRISHIDKVYTKEIIFKNVLIQKISDEANLLRHEVRYQKRVIDEYKEIINNQQNQIDNIKNSIPWRIGSKAAKPVKYLRKKL